MESDVGWDTIDKIKLKRGVGQVVQSRLSPLNFAVKTVAKIDHVVDSKRGVTPRGLKRCKLYEFVARCMRE